MAVMAGNKRYESAADLPDRVPVFPLAGALLLPSGQMPLNIFEPRYLAMIDAALGGDRLIGMIQPALDAPERAATPPLCAVGCLGRITQFSETGDGRYAIMLAGVSRFRVVEELAAITPYRQCRISVERLRRPDRAALRRGCRRPLGAASHLPRLSRRERARSRLGQREPRVECRPRHRALDDEPVGAAGEAGAA